MSYAKNDDIIEQQLRQRCNTCISATHPSNVKYHVGSGNGVKVFKKKGSGLPVVSQLHSSSMSGGKQPTEWQSLIKKVSNERKLGLKDAIQYIKTNNLYNKKT